MLSEGCLWPGQLLQKAFFLAWTCVILLCPALTAGTIQFFRVKSRTMCTDICQSELKSQNICTYMPWRMRTSQECSPSTHHSQQMKPRKSPQSVRTFCRQCFVQTGPSSQAESPASIAITCACIHLNPRQATTQKLQV